MLPFAGTLSVRAADEKPKVAAKDLQFLGVGECKKCHLVPDSESKDSLDFVLLTEYTSWRTLDKHAQAYAILVGPRGKQMGERLKLDVTDEKTGCLNCHAMNSYKNRGKKFLIEDGVSCEGCHGPAEKWLDPHQKAATWRNRSGADKSEQFGMYDLRDPGQRAAVCTSCHVGNASEGKVVTHAMFAAGHPPLPPFDLEVFSKNLPQHCAIQDVPFFQNDPPKGLDKATFKKYYHLDENPQFDGTKRVMAGNIVALQQTMGMVADRADLAKAGAEDAWKHWPELALNFDPPPRRAQRWPELAIAHSDCFSCHHELVIPSWRQQRGYVLLLGDNKKIYGRPGRPQVRQWSLALADLSLRQIASNGNGAKLGSDFAAGLDGVYQACNERPFGGSRQGWSRRRQIA